MHNHMYSAELFEGVLGHDLAYLSPKYILWFLGTGP